MVIYMDLEKLKIELEKLNDNDFDQLIQFVKITN